MSPSPTPGPTVSASPAPGSSSITAPLISWAGQHPHPAMAIAFVVIVAAVIAGWIVVRKLWAKLTQHHNSRGRALQPLKMFTKGILKLAFIEDRTQVFPEDPRYRNFLANVLNQILGHPPVSRFVGIHPKLGTVINRTETFYHSITWRAFWRTLLPVTLVTGAAIHTIPQHLTIGVLIAVAIVWIFGVKHLQRVLQIRTGVLNQMFEAASSDFMYPTAASLAPWNQIQITSWKDTYYPDATVVMFSARFRADDPPKRSTFEKHFSAAVSKDHDWVYDWETANNRVRCTPVPFITKDAPYPFPDRHPWDEFPLGIGSGGKVVTYNVSEFPHLLIAGTTGSGKSVTQRTLLLHALQKPEWRVCLVDPKRVELAAYAPHKHVLKIAVELEDAMETIEHLESEMNNRYKTMAAAGVNHFRNLPTAPPAILLMVDETFALLAPSGIKSVEGKEIDEMKARVGICLGSIARLGRAAGVHLILATQRPDAKVLPGEVKSNLDARIAQGRMDSIPSNMTLDSDAATFLPKIKGRALLRRGNDTIEFQAFYLPPEKLAQTLDKANTIATGAWNPDGLPAQSGELTITPAISMPAQGPKVAEMSLPNSEDVATFKSRSLPPPLTLDAINEVANAANLRGISTGNTLFEAATTSPQPGARGPHSPTRPAGFRATNPIS